jgi:winged helix DNA-binding protein
LKTEQPVAAELSWAQVHAFRLQRHHLARRAPREDLAKVVRDIGGAQAQLMSAAELQIAVRCNCTVADVREALWTDKGLVKTWLMRGTLHLASADELPLYCGATSRHWIRIRPSWLKYLQVSEAEFWKIVDDISAALNGTPKTREELIAVAGKGKSAHVRELLKSGWGGMLKPAARNGRLCFGPNRGQNVTFVRPADWLGWWREVDPKTALSEVARRYLRAYGPATTRDFARWWGAWPGIGPAAWSAIAGELATVSVEGRRLDMLRGDLDALAGAKVEGSVQLLPAFDPYVLGHANRDHLVERAQLARVSRTAGWISAVVLVDGTVAGTWTHVVANRTLRVTVEPFRRLTSAVRGQVRLRAAELARALGLAKTEVALG